jgi:hypothetical protein
VKLYFIPKTQLGKWSIWLWEEEVTRQSVEPYAELNKMDGAYAPSKHMVAKKVNVVMVDKKRA